MYAKRISKSVSLETITALVFSYRACKNIPVSASSGLLSNSFVYIMISYESSFHIIGNYNWYITDIY